MLQNAYKCYILLNISDCHRHTTANYYTADCQIGQLADTLRPSNSYSTVTRQGHSVKYDFLASQGSHTNNIQMITRLLFRLYFLIYPRVV